MSASEGIGRDLFTRPGREQSYFSLSARLRRHSTRLPSLRTASGPKTNGGPAGDAVELRLRSRL